METDHEILSDEELLALGRLLSVEDAKAAVLNVQRVKEIQFAYEVMRRFFTRDGVSISYHMNEPFKSMGSITLEAESFSFNGPFEATWFSRAVEFASNVEVYPLINGKLRMTLTFHELTYTV